MEQNIIGLGFDIAAFNADQQKILKGLLEVYNLTKEIGETSIKPGSSGGFTELKAKSDALAKLAKKYDELSAAQKKAEAAEIQANKAKQASLKTDQEVIKTMLQEEKVRQQEIKTKKEQLSYEQAIQKEKAKGLSQAAAEAKIAAQLTDEYGLLSRALKDQELRYKNLAITQGMESEAAQDALKTALDTRAVLDKLDTNLKNYGRNVGNYKSAFDGLGFSFSQIARELPSLTISAQQFFLAISNNLPMVFDEVKKAKSEIADLKAQGQEAPSLMSRIGKSIFSWNTALTVGITLLTVFGSKIVDGIRNLFGYSDSQEKAAESVDLLVKAQLRLIETQKELNELIFGNISETDRLEKELQITTALGKSKGDILKAELEIARIRDKAAISAYNESGGQQKLADLQFDLLGDEIRLNELITAQSRAVSEEARKTYDKDIERAQNKLNLSKKLASDQLKIVRENYEAGRAVALKTAEIEAYNNEQSLLKATEFAKIEAQAIINKNERILNDERNFEKERVNALRNAAMQREKIIDADLDRTLRSPGARNEDGTLTAEAQVAQKSAEAEKIKIKKDTEVAVFNVQEEFRKRRLAAELAISQARLEYAASEYQQVANQESKGFEERIEAYGDYYRAEQELIRQDYEFQVATKILTDKELIAIQEQTNKKLLDLARKSKKELSDIIVSTGQEQLKDAAALDGLKLSEDELRLFKSLKKKEQFTKKAAELEYKAQKDQLNNAIFIDKEIASSTKSTEDAKKAAQLRILENQKRLNELELSEEKRKAEEKKQIQDVYYQLELLGVQTFFDLAQKLSDNYYNKKFAAIDKERKMMEENYSKEVENIRNSTISEQEKAAIITQLNAREAIQKDLLLRKEKEEKIKQARTNKAINIAEIIVSTALAVVKALPNIPLSLLAGAAGAAALALAIATPIPTYGEGTDDHTGGPMIVGEKLVNGKYQPELVSIPGQKPFVTDRPMLLNAAPHTKVKPLTADTLNETMYSAMIQYTVQAIGDKTGQKLNEIKDATIQGSRMLISAINKQKAPVTNIIVDPGWHAHISKSIIN